MKNSYKTFPEGAQAYIDQALAYPKLPAKEEAGLFRKWKRSKSPDVKSTILLANIRYVVAIAIGYRYYPVDIGDLIAEGNLGLLIAFDKFDTRRKTRFITYAAYWIRALMLNHIIRSWHGGRTGAGPYRSKFFFKIKREKARSICRYGDCDTAYRDLARKMKLPRDKVCDMAEILEKPDMSMDSPLKPGSYATLKEFLFDDGPHPDEVAKYNEIHRLMKRLVGLAMNSLDAREKYIIKKRVIEEDGASLAEIGRDLGVSRERARQLEGRAKKKLRSSLERYGFPDLNAIA
ncbi:MAG: sigma-70 family RNA polymerase sigma factor [Pseudomonadota bacterium]